MNDENVAREKSRNQFKHVVCFLSSNAVTIHRLVKVERFKVHFIKLEKFSSQLIITELRWACESIYRRQRYHEKYTA